MPAAAVIPAPIAYIKVAAVKKLVVVPGRPRGPGRPASGRAPAPRPPDPLGRSPPLLGERGSGGPRVGYFEKTRVSKAGRTSRLEYISMG